MAQSNVGMWVRYELAPTPSTTPRCSTRHYAPGSWNKTHWRYFLAF